MSPSTPSRSEIPLAIRRERTTSGLNRRVHGSRLSRERLIPPKRFLLRCFALCCQHPDEAPTVANMKPI